VYGKRSGKHCNETQHESNNLSSLQDQKPKGKTETGQKELLYGRFSKILKPIWVNSKPPEKESCSIVCLNYSIPKIAPILNKFFT